MKKNLLNAQKHGISFDQAYVLWDDEYGIKIDLEYEGEERFAAVGDIDGKLWTAIATYRDPKIRIISVRRSREKEIKEYENRRYRQEF